MTVIRENLTFGDALNVLKGGGLVAREEWDREFLFVRKADCHATASDVPAAPLTAEPARLAGASASSHGSSSNLASTILASPTAAEHLACRTARSALGRAGWPSRALRALALRVYSGAHE